MWFNNGKESSLHLINLCLDSIVTLLTYVKTWILGNMTMFLRCRLLKALFYQVFWHIQLGYTVYKIGGKGACTTPWNHLPLIHIPDEK